ncbi:MAG: hypothetical protein K0R66_348 [Gammaproteobacteria bacterium]|jgi:hypothetical protein|nr:hypothetical protein [Gammaproteobacteria bacterium]
MQDYSFNVTPEVKDSIIKISQAIADARNSIAELFDQDKNYSWSRGCAGYEASKNILEDLAGTEGFEWLEYISGNSHLTFKLRVHGVIIDQVYRSGTDEDELDSKRLKKMIEENMQMDFFNDKQDIALHLVAKTLPTGEVHKIFLFAYERRGESIGKLAYKWEVPIKLTAHKIDDPCLEDEQIVQAEPVKQAAPKVAIKRKKEPSQKV